MNQRNIRQLATGSFYPVSARFAVLSGALFYGSSVFAVEPQGVSLGSGLSIFPDFSMSVVNDDNAYLQPDESKQELNYTKLNPGVALEGDFGRYQFRAGYEAEKGIYNSTYDDNYLDHRIGLSSEIEVSSRQVVDVSAGFKSGHDARGRGTVEGSDALGIKYPDEYNELTARGKFTHGADKAFANVSTRFEAYDKRYKNNFENGTRNRDHQKLTAGVQSSFYLSEDSGLLLDLSYTDVAYKNDSSVADNREGGILRALGGAGWDITGKTRGSVKVGVVRRSFDSDVVDDDTRLTWEANLFWSPKTYSRFTLGSAQSANETSGPGNYVDSSLTSLAWDYTISSFYAVSADIMYLVDDFYRSDDGRSDSTISFGLKGVYSPVEKFDLSLSFKNANRDSSDSSLDYSQNVVSLGAEIAI